MPIFVIIRKKEKKSSANHYGQEDEADGKENF
jgi:hypothetical protein